MPQVQPILRSRSQSQERGLLLTRGNEGGPALFWWNLESKKTEYPLLRVEFTTSFQCATNRQKKTRQSKVIKRGDDCPVLLHVMNETVEICAFLHVLISGDSRF